ncbi:HesA/MoeB/ThiF family protein [Nonomuraea sp. KM88]|uniref:HesA/MoeB/ThiF family protein n=1 Tax=Nonomuraea sp. KM88 TaxID=3457427 RepID=UPI003FCE7AD7
MRLPQIKRVHRPMAMPGGRIVIGLMQQGVSAEIQDDADGAIALLITLMDGTRTVDEICAAFTAAHGEADEDSIRGVIGELIAGGFVEDAGAPVPGNLTAREAERYGPQKNLFTWVDPTPRSSPYEVQSRIKDARVSLLGLGGTGTAVAAGLVSSGIGALNVADFDVVEEPNLTRQLLYTEADIGRPKVDAAVHRLRSMNSLVEVTGNTIKADGADDIASLIEGSVYRLGGLPTQARGRIFHWNFAMWDHYYFVDVPRYDDCPACGVQAS